MGIGQVRAVFLDRDGVINHAVVKEGRPHAPASLDEFTIITGADLGLRMLHDAGFLLVVVTNQPDVGRGLMSRQTVEAMHARMKDMVPLDDVRVCFDGGEHRDSEFRKPNPGMLLAAAADHAIDLRRSYMIGDRWKDIEAGKRAGVRTILIDYGYADELRSEPDYRVRSLVEAAHVILAQP